MQNTVVDDFEFPDSLHCDAELLWICSSNAVGTFRTKNGGPEILKSHLLCCCQWMISGGKRIFICLNIQHSPGSLGSRNEAGKVYRHCLHILTAETIKIWKLRTIYLMILDQSVWRWRIKRHFFGGGALSTQAYAWHCRCGRCGTGVMWSSGRAPVTTRAVVFGMSILRALPYFLSFAGSDINQTYNRSSSDDSEAVFEIQA